MTSTPRSDFPDFPQTAKPDFSLPILPAGDSKDRLIDVLQAQLRDVREELRSTQHEWTITEAKLEEARRALDRAMGMRL